MTKAERLARAFIAEISNVPLAGSGACVLCGRLVRSDGRGINIRLRQIGSKRVPICGTCYSVFGQLAMREARKTGVRYWEPEDAPPILVARWLSLRLLKAANDKRLDAAANGEKT